MLKISHDLTRSKSKKVIPDNALISLRKQIAVNKSFAKREKDFVELSAREQENSRLRRNLVDIFEKKHLKVPKAEGKDDNPSQLARLNYSLNYKNRAD